MYQYSQIKIDKYRLIRCFLWIVVLFPLFVQSQVKIKTLTNAEGLANNAINIINKDNKNNLWIGTWDGLSEYNGRDFKNYRYDENDSTSISSNIIRNIIPDSNYIWVATDFGINKLNIDTKLNKRYFSLDKTANLESSYQIAKDSKGDLYAFVRNLGFFVYNRTEDKFVPLNIRFNIKKMIIDFSDQLVLLDEANNLVTYQISKDSFDKTYLTQIQFEKRANLTNIFRDTSFIIYNYTDHLLIKNDQQEYSISIDPTKRISDVKISKDDFIYFSYYTDGLSIYDINTQRKQNFIGVPNTIFSLYIDDVQPLLWVGTDGQGLIQVTNEVSGFNIIRTPHPVRSFIPLDENEILVGTKGGGILTFDQTHNKINQYLSIESGLIDNSVYAMIKNTQGDIFVGTEGRGINIISKNKKIKKMKYQSKDETNIQTIYSLLFTNNDSVLWVGTSGFGLQRLELAQMNNEYMVTNITTFSSQNNASKAISNDIIYSLTQKDNIIYIGTRGGGVYMYDLIKNSFLDNKNINQNISKDVLYIYPSSENLNIGTTNGLQIVDVEDFSIKYKYSIQDGLLNNTVHAILGSDSALWISTNLGLSNINLIDNEINNYTVRNDLQNNEFSDGAAFKNKDNIYFFGGVDGFNYFDSEKIKKREYQPNLQLSEIKIYNNPINLNTRIVDNQLTLTYKESFVSFSFISKDFIDNENCEYAYRIPQLSKEWIQNGTNSNIVVSNLYPGQYTLEVKSTNGDKVWSNKIYELNIKALPPFWLSEIAIMLYILLFILAVYLTYRIISNRIKLNRRLFLEHIEKKNQEKIHENRINFFTDIAHEFFTPLSLIYGPAQYLLNRNLGKETKKYINIIQHNADRMQKLINELMEFRKIESKFTPLEPTKVDVRELFTSIFDNYQELAKDNNIDFRYHFDNVGQFITSRNYLERIVYNIVSNAFKYTPIFGYIEVNIVQKEDLLMTIKNSGAGLTEAQIDNVFTKFEIFDNSNLPNTQSTGMGMPITKGLVEMLGGTIRVSSEQNRFVSFEVSTPPLSMDIEILDPLENTRTDNIEIQQIKSKKILIIEDEKDIRLLLNDMLVDFYTIIQVSNPLEALDILKHTIPDLILTDIVMDEMDGFTLLNILKEDQVYQYIPVVTISVKISNEDHLKLLNIGVDAFIDKPFHPKEVLATIDNILTRKDKMKSYYDSELPNYVLNVGEKMHNEDQILLLKIIEHVNQNIENEKLNTSLLADLMHISKSTLTRKIKELKDCTPSELIKDVRLKSIAKQLKSSKKSVLAIMSKAGFSNKSYFYREFNKLFQMTPLEYRKRHQKDIEFDNEDDDLN